MTETGYVVEDGNGFLVLKIPLDAAHEPMVTELDDHGVDVSDIVSRMAVQGIETAIYQLYQSVKYDEQGK